MKVICDNCSRVFIRTIRQINEARKFGWKQFCSPRCLSDFRLRKRVLCCYNPSCCKKFERIPSQIRKSQLLFCSLSCSAKYYNALRVGSSSLRVCAREGCVNFIPSQNINIRYCGKECRRLAKIGVTKYSPELVKTRIRAFVQSMGRIPTRNELGYLNRLARNYFGSWNKVIIAAGFNPNPVRFANKFVANDGHKCDSLAEKIVDDYLSSRNIKHQVHVPYPWNNGMKCDFLISGVWIEMFGLEGQLARYDQLKTKKLKLIKKYGLRLVSVSLKDVYTPGKLKNILALE